MGKNYFLKHLQILTSEVITVKNPLADGSGDIFEQLLLKFYWL